MVPRNSATALADALARLATDANLRAEIGRQGLESFRANYTWETVRATYRQILSPAEQRDRPSAVESLQESYA